VLLLLLRCCYCCYLLTDIYLQAAVSPALSYFRPFGELLLTTIFDYDHLSCRRNKRRVRGLIIKNRGVTGSLPPKPGLGLRGLRQLVMHDNALHGGLKVNNNDGGGGDA
jgi:hypothetical protein